MKKVKTISMIALVIMLFISVDLGMNFFYSLIPNTEGIGNISILHRIFGIFGDSRWSWIRYFNAFRNALWITFVIFLENIILAFLFPVKK